MVSGLIAAITQIFLIAPLVIRWGEQRLVVIGSTLLLGSAIGISSGSFQIVLVAVVAYSIGFAISLPSLQAILTRFSSTDTAGRVLGLFQSAFSLAFIIAPLAAGFVLESFGPQAIFQGGALLMGLATFLGMMIFRLSLPISDESPMERSEPTGLLQRFHH